MVSPPNSSPRRPLHERSGSDSNKQGARLVPRTPPRLDIGTRDDVYSRTALPTLPSHVLSPVSFQGQGYALDESQDDVSELDASLKSEPSTGSLRPSSTQTVQSPTGSTSSRSRPAPKKLKHVAVRPDKTFSVLDILSSRDTADTAQPPSSSNSTLRAPSAKKSQERLSASYSITSPPRSPSLFPGSSATTPNSLFGKSPSPSPGHLSQSPYNFDIFGGLRPVPKTPDQRPHLDHPDYFPSSSATPSLHDTTATTDDGRTSQSRSRTSQTQSLTTQSSFLSDSDASTISGHGNENYKVHPVPSYTPSIAGTVVRRSPPESIGPLSISTKPSGSSEESENANYKVFVENTPQPATPPPASVCSSPDNRSPESYNPAYDITPEHSPTDTPNRSVNFLASPPLADSPNYKVFGSASPTSKGTDSGNYEVFASAPSSSRGASSGNYEVFASTPSSSKGASSGNYEVFGSSASSPKGGSGNYEVFRSSSSELSPASSAGNWVVHDDDSPTSSNIPNRPSNVPGKYSQESLVVAPLVTRAGPSNEDLEGQKSKHQKLKHRESSIGSLSENNTTQNNVLVPFQTIELPDPKSFAIPGSWAAQALSRPQAAMQASPHQWSSQLSTVVSESDDASTARNSRDWSDSRGRRSSGFPSSVNSRNMLSLRDSSLLENQESDFSESIERPQPARTRNDRRDTGSTFPMSSEEDEYSDRLSEMPDLRSRPSRSTLSGYFSYLSSTDNRTNSMRSFSSSNRLSFASSRPVSGRPDSRASRSSQSAIPAWARLYYGSGERKYLAAPGSSTEASDSSRPQSSWRSGSPNSSNFPLSIYSPRRRPRQPDPNTNTNRQSTGTMDILPASRRGSVIQQFHDDFKQVWRQTSSVWSPHLQTDRRAPRLSVWNAPSVNWSTEGTALGRRNVQVMMFIFGFIFPFAWMIAAVLPLPPNPLFKVQSHNDSDLDVESDLARQFRPMDEARYENAKWWRRLNRGMSVVGLLILGAIAALVVLGLREGWAS